MGTLPTNSRYKWLLGIVAAVSIVAGLLWWRSRCPADAGTLVRIEYTHQAGNGIHDRSYRLTVNGSGDGTVVCASGERSFSEPQAIHEIQTALGDLNVCNLPGQIGYRVVDGGWDSIAIETTTFEKTIELGFVPPEQRKNDEPRRAEQISRLVTALAEKTMPAE